MKTLRKGFKGQGFVDYAVVLVLIAVVVIIVVAVLGTTKPTPTNPELVNIFAQLAHTDTSNVQILETAGSTNGTGGGYRLRINGEEALGWCTTQNQAISCFVRTEKPAQ